MARGSSSTHGNKLAPSPTQRMSSRPPSSKRGKLRTKFQAQISIPVQSPTRTSAAAPSISRAQTLAAWPAKKMPPSPQSPGSMPPSNPKNALLKSKPHFNNSPPTFAKSSLLKYGAISHSLRSQKFSKSPRTPRPHATATPSNPSAACCPPTSNLLAPTQFAYLCNKIPKTNSPHHSLNAAPSPPLPHPSFGRRSTRPAPQDPHRHPPPRRLSMRESAPETAAPPHPSIPK